jgi:hypothetical protein
MKQNNRLTQLLAGLVIGLVTTIIGAELYLRIFTNFDLFTNFDFIKNTGIMGRVAALGSLLNLGVFTFLINRSKDYMARGCILAVIIITLATQFI